MSEDAKASKEGGFEGAVEIVTKIVGVLAAVAGLAGYVLVLGAAVLWFQLRQAGLPRVVPVSLAAHEELLVLGAQALAVWIALLAALGGLAAWIVMGDPSKRRFDRVNAGLALVVTLSVVLAFDIHCAWRLVAIVPTALALVGLLGRTIWLWPSRASAEMIIVPTSVAIALGIALHFLGDGHDAPAIIGAIFIFGLLSLATGPLQRWRAGEEARRKTISKFAGTRHDRLSKALRSAGGGDTPQAVVWIRRTVVGVAILTILGAVAVGSQVDKDHDFHRALVELKNGKCATGDYVATGADKLVLAQPRNGTSTGTRVALVPTDQVLEVELFPETPGAQSLVGSEKCPAGELLVEPSDADAGAKDGDGTAKAAGKSAGRSG